MRLFNFAIIKLTISLVGGILFGYFLDIELKVSAIVSLASLVVLIIVYFFRKRRFKLNVLFGILAFITTFFIGLLAINVHDQQNWANHYSKIQGFETGKPQELHLKVNEVLKPSLYQNKYFVELLKLNDQNTSGTLLLNLEKDSLDPILRVDDLLYVNTSIATIVKPLNPHQFDYSKYLEKKYVYHQTHVSSKELLVNENPNVSIKGMAHDIRETINHKLKQHAFDDSELAIINAILLGQKRDLSKDVYQQYSSAGVIHVLAVSGLHVGIILMILQFLFKPIEYLKRGKLIKTILIVALLWCFAIIAGLSPSVVRAVTMFSIVAVGMNMKRPTNIFNTLAISMFVLLLFKPMFLFDVGFQLSYLAVFAIVWIQPMLYRAWTPKLKVVDYFWQIFTVTIAAQIGVAPLSLFYFHQFPGLFFLYNLVIIPFLGLILGLGILVMCLALINALPEFISNLYSNIITALNTFVSWIAEQEAFLFKGISFGIVAVLFSYLLIVFGVRTFEKMTFKRLVPLLLVALLIQGFAIYEKSRTSSSFTILHKSRHSLIAFQDNDALKVFHSLDSAEIKNDNTLNDFMVGEHVKEMTQDSIHSVYRVNDALLLVIDSIPAYEVSFKADMVLLRNSPKVNLDRLIDRLQPKLIIADGSNYKSYVARWSATCKHKKLPFHATAKKGALQLTTLNE